MVAKAKRKLPTPARRAQRPDGDATRLHLIETAGQVFAERGYAEATSKEICERAGVPLASVNYHFGSRDGLYESVLIAAHRQLIGLEELMALVEGIDDPKTQLRTVLKHLAQLTTRADTPWGLRVLLRELIAPSAAVPALIEKAVRPKAQFMHGLVGAVMGLPPEHPSVQRGAFFAIMPCLTLTLLAKEAPVKMGPVIDDTDTFTREFMRYAMAGLRAMAQAHHRNR
jgi:AcrR family transcriptional regulator